MNGILLIDKPEGLTSAEVVRRVKRLVRTKVGHLGTLDPFATGLLPLCLGEATKIAQFLNSADKQYEGLIELGRATDTGDRTGATVRTADVPVLHRQDLDAVAERFTGDIQQMPPMYSALKREGVPLYRLARRGLEVERAPRRIHIAALRIEPEGPDRIRFSAECSKGTYVRVLAEDIGTALGSVAHLHTLRRTRFGPFRIEQAAALDHWGPGQPGPLISLREALAHLPAVAIDAGAAEAVRHGKTWVLGHIRVAGEATEAVLVDRRDAVVAVVVRHARGWQYGRVLADPLPLHAPDAVLGTESK